MGYREARQCQTVKRNILYWTKRWRTQGHNESRSQKVGSSDASSNALQHTDKEQRRNPPQYWETQDKIRLCCWCRREHETKAGRSRTQTSSKITSLQKGWIPWLTTVLFTNSSRCPQALKIPGAKAAVEKECEKTGENPGMAANESQKQERSDRYSREQGQKSSSCVIDGSLSSQEFGVGTSISEVQRSSRTQRWHCEGWFRIIRSIHGTRIISITDDSRKSHGHCFKASRMFGTSSWCSSADTLGQNGRCINIIWEFQSQNVPHILDASTEAQMAQIMVQYGRPSRSSRKESVRSPSGRTVMWKAIWESSIGTR